MSTQTSSQGGSRVALPGFGLPLEFTPETSGHLERGALFRTALSSSDLHGGYVALPLTTLREFTMLHLMNQLTDKPNWDTKVFDNEITAKWKAEALAAQDRDITEKMIDWCIAELQYKAKIFRETGAVSVYTGDVVKSDIAISNSLKEALKAAIAPLENVPARQQDWHPGSDEKVLDLVHPSLFPLVYGRSRILPNSHVSLEDCIKRCGEGEIVPVPSLKEKEPPRFGYSRVTADLFSVKFQWLPCEVDIAGDKAKITSYINNLHPQKHKDLYAVVEQVIDRAIPLWNMTLTPLKALYYNWNRIVYEACEYDPDPENFPEDEGPQQEDGEDEDTYDERRRAWVEATRRVVQPEPGEFKPPSVRDHMRNEYYEEGTETLKAEKTVDLKRDFGEQGLQVIVKLANIHLTPEKPEYGGGTWHVEGQLNEHICATALYYYDNDNITTSLLAFRQQTSTDDAGEVGYEQDHHDWLEVVFGCEQNGPAVQEVGGVDTKEGRLLTFPNILQHQVQPFRLADPTQPGHRKILALFLVDPNIRVISTANIPCQQRDWWSEHLVEEKKTALSHLPVELQDHVFGQVDGFPLGLEEAKSLRLELMEERKKFVIDQGQAFEANEFSLCEH